MLLLHIRLFVKAFVSEDICARRWFIASLPHSAFLSLCAFVRPRLSGAWSRILTLTSLLFSHLLSLYIVWQWPQCLVAIDSALIRPPWLAAVVFCGVNYIVNPQSSQTAIPAAFMNAAGSWISAYHSHRWDIGNRKIEEEPDACLLCFLAAALMSSTAAVCTYFHSARIMERFLLELRERRSTHQD